ncbi:hypothetical protein LTR17_019006 [Elasticomyces elasticus]|nr:hypothetical protein LTR17_019006 [Elasticomyces elasticus]
MVRTSRLLALPRDMRDMIYEFAVIGEHTLRIKQNAIAQAGFQLASSSGLLLACNQLSSEYFQTFTKTAFSANDNTVFQVTLKNLTSLGARRAIKSLAEEQLEPIQDGGATKLIVKLFFTSVAEDFSPPETENRIRQWTSFCEDYGLSASYIVGKATTSSEFWDEFLEEGDTYRTGSEEEAVCDALTEYFSERDAQRIQRNSKRIDARATRSGKAADCGTAGGRNAYGTGGQNTNVQGPAATERWAALRSRAQ